MLVHEYLHSIQYRVNEKTRQEEPLFDMEIGIRYSVNMDSFSEGATDLIRLELNSRLNIYSRFMSYPGESFAVYEVAHAIGQQRFWTLFAKGDLENIFLEFEKKYGEGSAERLFDSFYGGVALCNPFWTSSASAIPKYEMLKKQGLLSDERFSEFSKQYKAYFPPVSEKFINGPKGSMAFVNIINGKDIQMAIRDSAGKFTIITEESPLEGEVLLIEIPELKAPWDFYRTCVTYEERQEAWEKIKSAVSDYIRPL